MTLKNAKAKGSRNERRSRDLLESLGYKVTKAGGSLGVWDLVAISANSIVLVQVKSNRWPSEREWQAMRDFPVPDCCSRMVHRWDDYSSAPQYRKVINGRETL